MDLAQCPNCGCNLKAFEPIEFGNVAIDEAGDVLFEGEVVPLARTQRELAETLIQARGRLITNDILANILENEPNDVAIRTYVYRLRSAFRRIDPGFDQIQVANGYFGYRWVFREAKGQPLGRAAVRYSRGRRQTLHSFHDPSYV